MIRLVIADDHTMFARGLLTLLEKEEDFEILELFEDGKSLLNYLMDKPEVDIVLLDLNMPRLDGMQVLEEVGKQQLEVKIVVLSMYSDKKIFNQCQNAGVHGYVLKDAEPEELIYTIREVHEDRHFMHYQHVLDQAKVRSHTYFPDSFTKKFNLSAREFEILKHIRDGKTSEDIAEMLFLSIHTVGTHRKNIMSKLGARSVIDLVNIIDGST